MTAPTHSIICCTLAASMVIVTACDGSKSTTTAPTQHFTPNPCSPSGTLTLNAATAALVDCSGGGTTQALAASGASYLIVPQFATDQGAKQNVSYKLFTANTGTAASRAAGTFLKRLMLPPMDGIAPDFHSAPRNMTAQRTMERALRARAAKQSLSMVIRAPSGRRTGAARSAIVAPPTLGSLRTFRVASSITGNTFATVGATVSYVGTNLIIYIDTLAPANGFTAPQFLAFGQLFDQTLYPIDTAAFGPPSDIDNNGRVIMLMSPTVNADTPASTCQTQGYVAGFFDSADFNSSSDPNSNQGEVFYSIVPDPNAQFSCAHSVDEVGAGVAGTFMHELQHLINWSQHVVVSGSAAPSSWLDEGLSIVAEELGSLYYEQKCPPPQCRTSPAQLFPDSAETFAQDFPFDSYQYALLPDTASITLSTDDSNGISWRGGVWLFARWLGDQYGSTVYRQLERGPCECRHRRRAGDGDDIPVGLFQLRVVALHGQPSGAGAHHHSTRQPVHVAQHAADLGEAVRDRRAEHTDSPHDAAATHGHHERHHVCHPRAGDDDVFPP